MTEHVYKKTEFVGSSKTSIDDAIQKAIGKAAETIQTIDWFEVGEIRGHVVDARVDHYQVTLKIGFRIED